MLHASASWMERNEQPEKSRAAVRLALILGALAVGWYVLAMFLVVR